LLAQFTNDRALTPDELAIVAQKMVDATNPAEVERYREELRRGWYGGKTDASVSSQPSGSHSSGT
jgi:hypothetical protein